MSTSTSTLLPNATPSTSSTFCTAFQTSWRLIVIAISFAIINWIESDLFGAFVRSTIHCTNNNATNTTIIYPPNSGNWSGSNFCHSKKIVLQQATEISGQMVAVNNVLGICATLVVGSYIDTFGRKPLMLLTFLGFFLCGGLLFLYGVLGHSSSRSILFIALGITKVLGTFPLASQAMLADMTTRDETERGFTFMWLSMGGGLGTLIGFTGGFFVLQLCLTNYQNVWLFFTIASGLVGILAYCLLTETLKEATPAVNGRMIDHATAAVYGTEEENNQFDKQEKDDDQIEDVTSGPAALVRGCRLICRDTFLLSFLGVSFVANTGLVGAISIVTSFLIGKGKGWVYPQATASLVGVFMPGMSFLSYAFSGAFLIPWLGTKGVNMLGLVTVGIGFSIIGFVPTSANWFWIGWEIAAAGLGMLQPTMTAIISVRIKNRDQGKVLCLIGVLFGAAASVGGLVWTNYLYDSQAKGIHAGTPFLISAICVFSSFVLLGISWWKFY